MTTYDSNDAADTTDVITVRGERDLIALIPYQLGFRPEDSAVLLTEVSDADRRYLGLTVRMDLADLDDPARCAGLTPTVATQITRQGTEGLILVLFVEEQYEDARIDPGLYHSVATLDEAMPTDVPAIAEEDVWVVGDDGWGHLVACECCPRYGHCLEELDYSPAAAGMVVTGHVVASSREDLAVTRSASDVARQQANRAAQAEAVRRSCSSPEPWRTKMAHLWDGAVKGGADPELLGRLLAALADRQLRDAVVAAAMESAEGCTASYLDADVVAGAFDVGMPPDPEVADRAMTLAQQVAAHAPTDQAGPALGLLAYLAWWSNHGARADVVARQALAEEPGHRLAALVIDAIEHAVPPSWVRLRAT
ncbi:DUF4192 domain-containing protein [Georgenia halophila]|uniref:DUF4192 domain-containing protein n=1 Tax=Georgenia halophila TaxID=620889 RepID=A0ABP8LQB2_9MICO